MASHRPTALRINARELLRQPGLDKRVELVLPASDLDVGDARISADVAVDLTATSTIDSVVVRGTATMPWATECRRCLAAVTGIAEIEIDEVYQDLDDADIVASDDAFPIEGDRIDLAPAVREHLLLELPDDVLCRDDCAGICPVCGADRNTDRCGCDTTIRDERWAALDDLRLDGE